MSDKIIKLSIQEIVNDFYSLAEYEGYMDGLADFEHITENDKVEYHGKMKDLCLKYLPDYLNLVKEEYEKESDIGDKGLILSNLLVRNFKEMFYKLV